jgi:GDP-mannose 6-dehydrogenase
MGHKVTGVDRDQFKIQSVNESRAPFYEPGLQEMVAEAVASGDLSATADAGGALAAADIALLCVGTPSDQYGNIGLDQLDRVCAEIARHLSGRSTPLLIAIRSTVFPGTGEQMHAAHFRELPVTMVSNPEFLREGVAIRDFLEPSLMVAGSEDRAAAETVAGLYDSLGFDTCIVSLRTAEMIKYACNAFHAVKISFANEIGTLSAALGVSPAEVMSTLCRDHRLNISPVYLRPGFAFGGSCLPKDLRALNYRAQRLHQDLPMLDSVLRSNQRHLDRALRAILNLPVMKIAIFGIAFKEETDDLRESPVVALIEQLVGKGREVRVFDPHLKIEAIYGANRSFLFAAIPHIEKLMVGSIDELLEWSDHLVVAQHPAPELKDKIAASGKVLLDVVSSELPYLSAVHE